MASGQSEVQTEEKCLRYFPKHAHVWHLFVNNTPFIKATTFCFVSKNIFIVDMWEMNR